MAYKFNNGNGAVICDECSIMVVSGVTQDQVPDGQHICHKCAPKVRKKVMKKQLYRAA